MKNVKVQFVKCYAGYASLLGRYYIDVREGESVESVVNDYYNERVEEWSNLNIEEGYMDDGENVALIVKEGESVEERIKERMCE